MVAERARLYVADPVNLTASFTYPATSLLSYLFQFIPGHFAEWQCLAAIDILALASFAPLAALPRARWPHSVLLFAAAAVLPFFFSTAPVGTASTVYRNAMADLPLACLFGGALCLYQAAGGRRGGFYAVALPLAVLAMTKDIGLAYGLIAVFLIGVDQLFGTQQPEGWRRLRVFGYRLARTALLAVPVLAVFVSWSRYTAAMAPEAGSSTVGSAQMSYGAVLLGGVCQLLGIGREARFAELMQTMAQALVSRRVCLLGPPAVVLGLVAGLSLLAFLGRAQGRAAPPCRGGLFRLCVLLCGAVPFPSDPLFLQFLRDRSRRPQGLRALPDAVFAGLDGGRAVPAGPVRRGGPRRARCAAAWARRGVGLAAVGFLAVFAWRGVPTAGFWTRADSLYSVRADVKARAGVMNEVLDWNDRVLVISQGDDATRWYYYKYELTARVINGYGGVWWGDSDYSSRWDSDFMNLVESLSWTMYDYTAVCTEASLIAYMDEKNCDYLVLDRADEYLERDFSARFEGGLKADQPATLYKFLGPDAEVPFVPVATAESGVGE